MDASPSKRRVLGPLHVNTNSPAAGPRLPASKLDIAKASTPTDLGRLKRPLDQENVPPSPQPTKKPRVLSEESHIQMLAIKANKIIIPEKTPDRMQREHSGSPDEPADSPSIFDTSVIDTSQDTTITEPDAEPGAEIAAPPLPAPPPLPRQRPAMTREEARQKAEILRLRLGLASYKVRTGQADVPLDRLKLKPLPGPATHQQQCHPRSPPQLPHLPPPLSPRQQRKQRSGEPASQRRRALPVGPPLQRSNSNSNSNSFCGRRALSPGESWPKARSLPPSMGTLRDDDDNGDDDGGGSIGPLSGGGLQSGAAKGLLSLSRG